jgi:HlyD family secretion protein
MVRLDSELINKTIIKSSIQKVKALDNEISKLSEIVFENDMSVARERKVKTGIQDNNFIEIIEGIRKNEEIIFAPFSAISKKLKDNTLIKVEIKKICSMKNSYF